eukprot:COSAG01_NODE_341_length_18611_cov_31.251513_7_plen_65_part_00
MAMAFHYMYGTTTVRCTIITIYKYGGPQLEAAFTICMAAGYLSTRSSTAVHFSCCQHMCHLLVL